MWLISEIWPVILVGDCSICNKRLEHKYKHGKLGKKKSKEAQLLLDSFIPIGMLLAV